MQKEIIQCARMAFLVCVDYFSDVGVGHVDLEYRYMMTKTFWRFCGVFVSGSWISTAITSSSSAAEKSCKCVLC